jgi:hypothetical protein
MVFTLLAIHNDGEARQLAEFFHQVRRCQTVRAFKVRPVPSETLFHFNYCHADYYASWALDYGV